MLKIKVKVGPINNLSDARYCAGMGVDMLGFSVGGAADAIDPKKYQEITSWVSGPDFVAEWSGSGVPENFALLLQSYNAPMVQVDVTLLKNIPPLDAKLIIALPLNAWPSVRPELISHRSRIAFVLLSDVNSHFDGPAVADVCKEFSVLLSNVGVSELESISSLPIAGISLRGTAESRPGVTDYSNLEEIFERLEKD